MSTLYLIEGTNTVLTSSLIDDTVNVNTTDNAGDDYYPIRGSFPVSVPFDIPMDALPLDLSTLISHKYTGMLSIYPGYTYILYDEQIDATGWNYSASSACTLGDRQNVSVMGDNGLLQSVATTLYTAPTSCIFRYETFRYVTTNPADLSVGQLERSYQEVNSEVFCSVSFNNGSTWNVAPNGVLQSIALPDQGDQFLVRFATFSGQQTYLGSWALVYG